MDYLIDRKSGRSYASEFLSTQGKDVHERVSKAISNLESGHRGHVTRIKFKNELYHAPLYEYEIDYKQGFRIYFTEEKGYQKIMTIGVKKNQRKDIAFCCSKYANP